MNRRNEMDPRQYDARTRSDFSRTLTGSQCRKRFPNTARLRLRLVSAGPRRKMDFQTRVARNRSNPCWNVVAILPSDLETLAALDDLQFVHDKFPVRRERNGKVRQGTRRGPLDLCAVGFELAAVARAGDLLVLGLPLRDAAQMRAHGRDREEGPFRGPHDVYLLVLQVAHGIDGEQIRVPGAECRGGLKQHVG